jgi:Sel1 repeat
MGDFGKGFDTGCGFAIGLVFAIIALPLVLMAGCAGCTALVGTALYNQPASSIHSLSNIPPLVESSPTANQPVVQSDVDAQWQTNVYVPDLPTNDALGRWQLRQAESGDATSQYLIGIRYRDGDGVAKDPRQAREWLAKAAAQGDKDASSALQNLPEN